MSKTFLFSTATIILFGLTFLTSNHSYSSTRRFLKQTQQGCISRKNKLVYVHIPKTGGSTIERSKLFEDADIPMGHMYIWQMMKGSKKTGISNFVTATTVRHPCERFISAFRYLTSDKCHESDKKLTEEMIGDLTLDQYVHQLRQIQWKRVQQHFTPQYKFVVNKDERSVGVDNILCQEHWDEGIQRLENAIGTTESLPRLNKHILQNNHETCQDLKPQTRKAIEKLYFMDYCLFDYPSNSSQTSQKQCVGKNNDKRSLSKRLRKCWEAYEQFQWEEFKKFSPFHETKEPNIAY